MSLFSKRRLYYALPPSLRFFIRRLYYLPSDTLDAVRGHRDPLVPPRGMIFIGPGDYKKIGHHYLQVFREKCALKPNHHVLDVGCGIGRIAGPLTTYISHEGSYDGFDIVASGIEWCQKNIQARFPNFKFLYTPLKNDLYNLNTSQAAQSFKFPYPDGQFDLVVLTSVFTHMMPADMEHYIAEISRVLKPGGRCLATYFILNPASEKYMSTRPEFRFEHSYGDYSLMDPKVKEANTAFQETYLERVIASNGLRIDQKLYGFWSGRPKAESFDFQDTMILQKPE